MAQPTNRHTDAAIRMLMMLNNGHEPYAPAVGAVQQWLADYDDALHAQLAQAEQERDEAKRRWDGTVGTTQRDYAELQEQQHRYSLALAASQARERALREALEACDALFDTTEDRGQGTALLGASFEDVENAATMSHAALAQPPGDEALRAWGMGALRLFSDRAVLHPETDRNLLIDDVLSEMLGDAPKGEEGGT